MSKEELAQAHLSRAFDKAVDKVGVVTVAKSLVSDAQKPVNPVALVTVRGGKCVSTRSADFRKVADGDYSLYTAPPTLTPPDGREPITTAPKDGSRILLFFHGPQRQEFGKWNEQRYHTKPRPYWTGDCEHIFGVGWYRNNKPTHWKNLSAAPQAILDMDKLMKEVK